MKIVIILIVITLQLNAKSFTVYVKNILQKQGDVALILYNLKMEEQFGVFFESNSKSQIYKFVDLQDKQYILVAYQDKNKNGYLDKNEKYLRQSKNLKKSNTKTIISMKKTNMSLNR